MTRARDGTSPIAAINEILFIKTSSLGDVIHMMPAIAEARDHFPEAKLTWVVEEAFAPLAALYPAVDRVIRISLRRWRQSVLSRDTRTGFFDLVRDLRTVRYDAIIDTQGLIRSAVVARLARGTRHGYDRASVRERPAVSFYDVEHTVDRKLHAIERARLLTGAALGYIPGDALDYGLSALRPARSTVPPYALLLHATSAPEKCWHEGSWIEIGGRLGERGLTVVLPSGTEDELTRSRRMATAIAGSSAPETSPLDQMAKLVGGASLVVGVDTGLLHLAAALDVPLVGVFTASEPALTGPRGNGPIEILGANRQPPGVSDVAAAIDRVLGRVAR